MRLAQREPRERQCQRSTGRREDSWQWHEPTEALHCVVHASHASWLWPAGRLSLEWMDDGCRCSSVPLLLLLLLSLSCPCLGSMESLCKGSARTYCCTAFTVLRMDGIHGYLILPLLLRRTSSRLIGCSSADPGSCPCTEGATCNSGARVSGQSQRCPCKAASRVGAVVASPAHGIRARKSRAEPPHRAKEKPLRSFRANHPRMGVEHGATCHATPVPECTNLAIHGYLSQCLWARQHLIKNKILSVFGGFARICL